MSAFKHSARSAALSALSLPLLAHAGIEFGQVHPTSTPGNPYTAIAKATGIPSTALVSNAPVASYENLGLPAHWAQLFQVHYHPKSHNLVFHSDQALRQSAVIILDIHASHGATRTLVECPLPGQPAPFHQPRPKVVIHPWEPAALTAPSHHFESEHMDAAVTTGKVAASRLRSIIHQPQPAASTPTAVPPLAASPLRTHEIENHTPHHDLSGSSKTRSWQNSPFFHVGKGHIVAVLVDHHWRSLSPDSRQDLHPPFQHPVTNHSLSSPQHTAISHNPQHSLRAVPIKNIPLNTPSSHSILHRVSTPFLHGYGVPYLANGWAFTRHVGPVRSGQTLYKIAENVNASQRFTTMQIMVAIFRMNQKSFIDGNPNLLRKGAILTMPSFDDLKKMTPAHALVWWQLYKHALSTS